MKHTKEPQIKTLEIALIYILQNAPPTHPAQEAFQKVLTHFIDEDFLYAHLHEKIISLIYQKNIYANCYAYALPRILNMDNKTLLECRKNYLLLFAKYYLGLRYHSKNIFILLYSALKKEKSVLEKELNDKNIRLKIQKSEGNHNT